MKKKNFKTIKIFFVFLFCSFWFFSFVSSDIISINPGGSQEIAMTPSRYIEGFFFGIPTPTPDPDPDPDPDPSTPSPGPSPRPPPSLTGFIVVPESFEINLELGTSVERSIIIRNLESREMTLSISKNDSHGIITLEKTSVRIGPEEVEEVMIKFTSPRERGIYQAEIIVDDKIIPVELRVFEQLLLFDSRIIVLNRESKVVRGEDLKTRSTLIPMTQDPRVDITLDFKIVDYLGNVYVRESETLLIQEQIDFDKDFKTRDLPPGLYLVTLDLIYLNGIAPSSAHFEVLAPDRPNFLAIIIFILLLLILIIGIILILILIRRYKKRRDEIREREAFLNS